MLYDFPLNADARCLELLSSVMQKGNRCGIYVVLCRNTAVEVASSYDHIDEKLAELEKNCVQIECKENGFALLPYHLSVRLIENPMPDSWKICGRISQGSRKTERSEHPF